VLVSEAMLQQTQVATVVPYFRRWMERFPTVEALAAAEEGEVLRLWQGLGYYSRARNLQKAAKCVMAEFGGEVPTTVEGLRRLPGVGPYTAGAVASIAFEVRAAIVDGNVERVISRLDARREDPRSTEGKANLWARALELVEGGSGARPGDFNSAVMELGATICSPRRPNCLVCPVSAACRARELGIQEEIPPPKKAKITPEFKRDVFCHCRGDRRWLIEQRPTDGRWGGLWQFPTREAGTLEPGTELGEVRHALTHRRYIFRVMLSRAPVESGYPTAWATLEELDKYALPKPHLAIAKMLASLPAE
jgi:A/G-specific adenine glycosylase